MNLLWNRHTRSLTLQLMQYLPIHRGRVMCVCWGGKQYNCNPRAIVEALSERNLIGDKAGHFEVYFAFLQPEKFASELPPGVKTVLLGGYDYFRLLATSQFIIANTRIGGSLSWPKKKRRGQIYIQTMHGGHGIKKIDHDADLPDSYMKVADEDNSRIDLMVSDSRFRTNVFHTAFHYYGEVLETGLPRNYVFFRENIIRTDNKRYLVYAPTFRNSGRRDVYGFDVDKVISALEKRFGGEWYIRISSHPNMRDYYKSIYNFSHPRLIDIGGKDLQDYLPISDALITDYSSAEMDFSLTGRPIFQLCRDRHDYDRGFYINPEDLPFPYAENDAELVQNILSFDVNEYLKALDTFNRDIIGLNETGHASEAVIRWMLKHVDRK